jgi:hypothetical protein
VSRSVGPGRFGRPRVAFRGVVVVDPRHRTIRAGELVDRVELPVDRDLRPRTLEAQVLPAAAEAEVVRQVLLGALLPPRAPDALEGASQALQARPHAKAQPMRNAFDRDGEPRGRAGLVEAEEGDHPVDVDQKKRSFILHLERGR